MECDYGGGRFYSGADFENRKPDAGIYPRVAASAGALAALLTRDGRRLSVAGPSRLTGSFGATAVKGIGTLPVAGD